MQEIDLKPSRADGKHADDSHHRELRNSIKCYKVEMFGYDVRGGWDKKPSASQVAGGAR